MSNFIERQDRYLPERHQPQLPESWAKRIKAHPKRGKGWHEVAVKFSDAKDVDGKRMFALGSKLTTQQFGNWAVEIGEVESPASTEKGSPEWRAYVQDLNILKDNINLASTHPRMFEEDGIPTFKIVVDEPTVWRVAYPEEVIGEHLEMVSLVTGLMTNVKHLEYAVQAMNPHTTERSLYRGAHGLLDQMQTMQATIKLQAEAYNRAASLYLQDFHFMLEQGEDTPTLPPASEDVRRTEDQTTYNHEGDEVI